MDDETENLPQYTGPDSFAGLPGRAAAPVDDRPSMINTLPKAAMGLSWRASGRPDTDLIFRMVELDPEEQDRAAKLADGNQSALGRELVLQVIRQVGARKLNPLAAEDRSTLEAWWRDIGPKGRRFVDTQFLEMSHPSEGDVQTFLSSGVVSAGR